MRDEEKTREQLVAEVAALRRRVAELEGGRRRPPTDPASLVTPLVRAEEALRESEQRYRTLFEHLSEGLAVHEMIRDEAGRPTDYRFLAVNPAFEGLTGLKREEITGRTVREMLPGIEQFWIDTYDQVARSGNPIRFEQYSGPLGKHYEVVAFSPEKGRFATLFFDVSGRRQAEVERERHLARQDTLIRVSQAILAETALPGLLQSVVDAARELTGARIGISGFGYRDGYFRVAASSDSDGKPLGPPGQVFAIQRGGVYLDLIHKEESLRLTDEELRRHPAWWGLPEGHRGLRGLLGARLVGRDGQPAGLIMVSDREQGDFTAEDEALLVQLAALASLGLQHIEATGDAERRASELQAVLDNMVDGVFVADAERGVSLANEAGACLLGLAGVAEARRPLAEFPALVNLRHPDGTPVQAAELPLARALAGDRVTLVDEILHNLRTGRDVYLRTSAAPIRDRRGEIVAAVAVARDVTELIEFERQKDQFIAVAAHELKTPVAVMKGYAQAILRRTSDLPPERRKLLEAIDRGANRMDRVVQDLLDISRLLAGSLELSVERVALDQLVEEVVDRMALTTARHQLRVARADPVAVRGDRDRLEQVVANLVDNAVRYSPQGGDIEVEVALGDGEVVVSVADHGVGIPAEKQVRIFQRFYRAHTGTPYDYGGMGVGLYICQEILARHGGRMWFESQEGVGSTFHFSLPL